MKQSPARRPLPCGPWAVFGWRARDGARRFRAALSHLGRDQRGVGGEQARRLRAPGPTCTSEDISRAAARAGLGDSRQSSSSRTRTMRSRSWRRRNTSPTEMPLSSKSRVHRGRGGAADSSRSRRRCAAFVEPVGVRKACNTSTRRLHVADQRTWKGWLRALLRSCEGAVRGKPGRRICPAQ